MQGHVSHRKNLETQLRQSQKMDALGRLAAGVAHDFNNLLGVILGYSQLLLEEDLPETATLRAKAIMQAGERGAALTRQLLIFSRQEVVQPKVLYINAVFQNMESMLMRMIGEDVNLCMIAKSRWRVKTDPGQIEQVLMNLVINARDAMPDGGVVTVQSEDVYLDTQYVDLHSTVSAGPYVQLAVRDTGVGMDLETRVRIFEPFFTTKTRGTGLGLSTVYGIVKQCGGALSVYSEPGQGAVFKVYLPAVTESRTPDEPAFASDGPGGRETVLIAEDEESYREVVRDVLASKGYEVLVAKNGKEARMIAEGADDPIDVLLTDSIMPGETGGILAKELKLRFPKMKIIMMSGYSDRAISPMPLRQPICSWKNRLPPTSC